MPQLEPSEKFEPIHQEPLNQFITWLDMVEKHNGGVNPLADHWEWKDEPWFHGYVIRSWECEALAKKLHDIAVNMPPDPPIFLHGPQMFTVAFAQGLRHSASTGSDVSIQWGEHRR